MSRTKYEHLLPPPELQSGLAALDLKIWNQLIGQVLQHVNLSEERYS